MGHLGFAPRADWRYLPSHARGGGLGDDERGPGERDAGNYYMHSAEGGEPPGRWYGPGAAVLGFEVGQEVTSEQMETVYGKLEHPQTAERLGSKPRTYASHEERVQRLKAAEPDASPEREKEIEFQARKQQREACHYYDLTYSPEKSWSVLYAGLKQAGMDAEADSLWQCMEDGYRAGLEHAMASACYARTGRHSGKVAGRSSGRWEKAQDWTATLWRHHTSRDGDPNLHIHGALLNRVQVEEGGKWYALDGTAVKHARREAAAVASRAAEAYAAERLGLRFVARADGLGREIAGVDERLIRQFSSRRRAIEPEAQQLAAAYAERYGKEPSAYQLRLFAQQATMATRARKPEHPPTQDAQLAQWEAQVRDQLGESLAQVPAQVGVRPHSAGAQGTQVEGPDAQPEAQAAQSDAQVGEQAAQPARSQLAAGAEPARSQGAAPAQLSEEQRAQVIAQAVAQVSGKRSVWRRSDLTAAIDAHLPVETLTLPAGEQAQLLSDLTEQALAGGEPVRLTTDPLVSPPTQWRREEDGRGLHEAAAVYDRYSTRATVGREQRLVDTALQAGATAADPSEVEAQLEETGLRGDQRQVVERVLTSGQRVDVLIGPAGAGKSHTLGQLAHTWTHAIHPGEGAPTPRVLGLAPSENATRVLRDAGINRQMNVEGWRWARRKQPEVLELEDRELATLRQNDLVVVDEASMASAEQLEEVVVAAGAVGAKVLVAGDDRQLGAVEEGGGFALLAERCGPARLTEAVRFTHQWERDVSLRLRDGDADALREYDRRGRIHAGPGEEIASDARERFLADYLTGRDTLILAATSEQAAEHASHIRAQLVEQGRVEQAGVRLRDDTTAGSGDLIQTRENNRQLSDGNGGWVANRDTWRVDQREEDGSLTVRRQLPRTDTGEARWGDPVTLPASYVGEQVELGYASTVHAAQGRTVDTAYTLVDPQMGPETLYVAMTRARERTLVYVPTDAGEADALGHQATEREEPPTPEAILAGILERQQDPESATQVLGQEVDARESLARLAPEWQDLITSDAHARYRGRLEQLLTTEQAQRLEGDAAYAPLLRAVRAAEASGRDADQLLGQAVTCRELGSAISLGQVLYHRVTLDTPPEHLQAQGSYAARTPRLADPKLDGYARELAEAMDTRVSVLGEQAATDPPAWTEALGPVPEDPAERLEWTRRAGQVAAYREEHGYWAEQDAIGPAPHAGAPEARQGWLAAWDALGRPDEQRDTAAASDGDLLNLLEAWQREEDRAPVNVDDELRSTARRAANADRDARLAQNMAEMFAAGGHDPASDKARRDQARAREARAREQLAAFEEQAAVRQEWYDATGQQRRAAQLARDELARRHDRELDAMSADEQPDSGRRQGKEIRRDEPDTQPQAHTRQREEPEPAPDRQPSVAVRDRDDQQQDEHAWDSRERREQLRAELEAAGIDEEAIEARMIADIGSGRPPEDALRQAELDDEEDERHHAVDEPDRDRGIEL